MVKNKNQEDIFSQTEQYLKDNPIPNANLLYESNIQNPDTSGYQTHYRDEAKSYIPFDSFSEALQNLEKLYDAKNLIITTEIKEDGKSWSLSNDKPV